MMAHNIAKTGFLRGGGDGHTLSPPLWALMMALGIVGVGGMGYWGRVLGGCCGGRGGLGCGGRGRESGCWVWGKGVLDWGGVYFQNGVWLRIFGEGWGGGGC